MNDQMIRELIEGLVSIYTDKLDRVVLFGSYARGTQSPESDIDVAVILNRQGAPMEREALIDFLVDLELKYDKVLSVVDIDNHDFVKWKDVMPFYKNVQSEGVVLWKAA